MKQKKISFTVLLLLGMGITALQAQQSANASGGNATGIGGTSSYSVGQVAYTYNAGSSNQGVQQPYEFFTTGIDENKDISLSMTVFPNPVQSTINLKVEGRNADNLSYVLYDVSGKQYLNQKITGALTQVPMQNLQSGSYVLQVVENQKTVKTFTIIKNN